jgi:hypothetical protein
MSTAALPRYTLGSARCQSRSPGPPRDARAAAPRPRLTLLGGFGLYVGHDEVYLPPSPQRLLALLGLHERALRRGYVAGLLWGDSTETHASGCLRSALWKLRVAGLGVVQAIGDNLTLSPDICVDVNSLSPAGPMVRAPSVPTGSASWRYAAYAASIKSMTVSIALRSPALAAPAPAMYGYAHRPAWLAADVIMVGAALPALFAR